MILVQMVLTTFSFREMGWLIFDQNMPDLCSPSETGYDFLYEKKHMKMEWLSQMDLKYRPFE